MRLVLTVLLAACAVSVHADCVGQPSLTMRGWKSIAKWTLPGDMYGVAYLCSGANRKLVVERFTNRFAPDVRYVGDVTLPKLNKGEMLIARADCVRAGARDPYIVPFGQFTKKTLHIQHAWRVEMPSGRIVTVDAKALRCEAPQQKF